LNFNFAGDTINVSAKYLSDQIVIFIARYHIPQDVNILAQRARLWVTPERGCTTSMRNLQVKIVVLANLKVLPILRPKHREHMKRSWSR